MNWLDAAIHIFDLVSEITGFLRGMGMDSEYVPLIALMLMAGGILFWFFLAVAFVVGLGRAVRRVFWWIGDMHYQMKNPASGGTIPHVE